ncbi:MAG: heavy metal-binding domain-containing protein [Deinococcales bacterium]
MLVVTTETIQRQEIERVVGQAFGVVVRSRGLGGNITAALRSLGGGEIKEYTELLEDARKSAIDRLVKNAHAMGANAVLGMRFDSSEVGQNMSELVAYGTAVVVHGA